MWVCVMFQDQFSRLEHSIQQLVRENQQLKEQCAKLELEQQQQQSLLLQKQDELETLELTMMDAEEQQKQTAQQLEQLLALFNQPR